MNYKKILEEVRKKSYPEIRGKVFLIKLNWFPAWAAFLWLIPRIRFIIINPKHCDKISKKETEAIIAHELAHGIQGKRAGYFLFWFKMIPYFLKKDYHKKMEAEADIIAVKRGYVEGMIKVTERLNKDKKTRSYITIKELEKYRK